MYGMNKSTRGGKSSLSGMTLMELIIAMCIMVTIAAASIPSFIHFMAGSRIRGSAQNIVSALNGARRFAITQRVSRAVYVYMDAAAGVANAVSFYETQDVQSIQYMGKNVTLEDEDTPATQMLTFTFNARGGVSVSPLNHTIRVKGPNNKYIDIDAIPATGNVRMGELLEE